MKVNMRVPAGVPKDLGEPFAKLEELLGAFADAVHALAQELPKGTTVAGYAEHRDGLVLGDREATITVETKPIGEYRHGAEFIVAQYPGGAAQLHLTNVRFG